jgi:hypothetical protein
MEPGCLETIYFYYRMFKGCNMSSIFGRKWMFLLDLVEWWEDQGLDKLISAIAGEDFGEVKGAAGGVLADLLAAAEAV